MADLRSQDAELWDAALKVPASAWDEIHLRACGQLESRRRRFSGEGRRQRLIISVGVKKLQGK